MNIFSFIPSSFLAMAPAPAEGGDPSGQLFSTLIMFGSVILIFYFFILRPQQKRQKEQKDMIESMKKGDKVVLASGIHGTLSEIQDDIALIQIADNTRIRVDKSAISALNPKKSTSSEDKK